MIDTQHRLCKLVGQSLTFEVFKGKAVDKSHWYLSPYALAGIKVDRPWLELFWQTHKNKGDKNNG